MRQIVMIAEQGDALYAAVQLRPRPEDVADLVEQVLHDQLLPWELALLERRPGTRCAGTRSRIRR